MSKLIWNDCTVEPQSALFGWADEKALEVHEGGFRGDESMTPARRWTDEGLANCDPMEEFVNYFDGSFEQAFQAMAGELADAFQEAFDAPIYDWDRITLRSTGELVGTPRDIVDTGELRNSQYLILSEGA